MFADLSIPELVDKARTMFQNAATDAEIMGLLAPFGYDAADLDAALDLVEDVEDLDATQAEEYADQYEATAAANAAVAALEAKWVRHRKLARATLQRGSEDYRALGLRGTVPDDDARAVHQAEQFYRVLTIEPARLTGLRFTAAEVAEGLALADAAHDAMAAQQDETGEAQRATRLRDDQVAVLRATAHEFAEVAKVALEDHPQLREKLGLKEPS